MPMGRDLYDTAREGGGHTVYVGNVYVFSSTSDDLHDCVVDLPSFQFCALLVYYHSRLVNTKLVFNCVYE